MFDIISLIINLLLGSGLIGTFIFYRSKRRVEAAQARSAELGVRRESAEFERSSVVFLQGQLSDAYVEIDKMQEIINAKREEIIELIRRTKDLEVALIEFESTATLDRKFVCFLTNCSTRCTSQSTC